MKKKIIIFGGSGFIGKNLAQRLINKDFLVTVVSRNKSIKFNLKNKNLEYLNCDITNINNIKKKIKKSYDFIINLSGNINHKKKKETFETHFKGCKNLIQFFKKKNISLFLQIGSSLEYGNLPSPQNENFKCKPVSYYGKAKLKSTNYLMELSKHSNFPFLILRLYQVYGPNQKFDRLIPQVIKSCLDNRKFKCTDGSQIRDFLYVEDLVNLIEKILLTKKKINHRILNVGCGSPIAVKKVIENINKIIKKGIPQYGKIQMRKDESSKLYPSIKKVKNLYKWKPKFSLIKGLKKTILFYKKNKNFLY